MAQEKSFRPTTFEDYQGQEKVKKALKIYIKSAKKRNDTLDHTIIYGNSGLGKSTLANIIANEMGGRFRVYAAPSIKKISDVMDILLNTEKGDIIFLDEIHRLSSKCEEQLFLAMEQFTIEAIIDDLPQRVDLPHFTLIGATTSHGMLSEPFRNRFGISVNLQPYKNDDMIKLVHRSFKAMNITIESDIVAKMIADRGRGVPRIINNFVRRVRDFAIAMNSSSITQEVVEETFDILEIDSNGLTKQDYSYLEALRSFNNRAVGIDLLSAKMNEDKSTVENTIEPYLLQKGYIIRTPRGRMITEEGKEFVYERD